MAWVLLIQKERSHLVAESSWTGTYGRRKRENMMELWDRNLEVLQRRDPALAACVQGDSALQGLSIEPAKNGEPIVKRDGICLHSSYDPSREAEGWLKKIGC